MLCLHEGKSDSVEGERPREDVHALCVEAADKEVKNKLHEFRNSIATCSSVSRQGKPYDTALWLDVVLEKHGDLLEAMRVFGKITTVSVDLIDCERSVHFAAKTLVDNCKRQQQARVFKKKVFGFMFIMVLCIGIAAYTNAK
ncbi:MAG: hypothetical protein CL678_15580 [Bdellovibrionaceae bacterium]|nr:hypothetical protein [Pseudobdellovibrionaceae bacterium]|tara:strand:+ start:221 stop:646 length:426 start_codon:yes stop_codon:yes gene_type:complete